MPHNEGSDLIRFDNACQPVCVRLGNRYPRCDEQQLYEQSHAIELCSRFFRADGFHHVSLDQAAAELINFVRIPPNTTQQLIIDDLLDAFNHDSWMPELVIKAFGDLDKIYFNGIMKRKVQIEWCCNPVEEAASPLFPYAYAMTFQQDHTVIPTAKIVLNAEVLFKLAYFESRRRKVWGTVIHEMVHAYLITHCGTAYDGRKELLGNDPSHGRVFKSIVNELNSRTTVKIGFDISWQKELLRATS